MGGRCDMTERLTAEEPIIKRFRQELIKEDCCPKCLGELDEGWECNQCGYDAVTSSAWRKEPTGEY